MAISTPWAPLILATTLSLTSVNMLAGQKPPVLEFPPGPAIVALGGAGAAASNGGSVALNPAAIARLPVPSIRVGVFQTRRISRAGITVAGAFGLPWDLRMGLALHQKGISDLIEDPAVPDGALGVGHTLVRVGLARQLLSQRITAGFGVSAVRSEIFATTGTAYFIDAGVNARVHPNVTAAAAILRVGQPMRWETPGGGSRSTDLGTALRLGVLLSGFHVGPVTIAVRADAEAGQNLDKIAASAGIEVGIADVTALRFGLSDAYRLAVRPTGGLALRIGPLRLDLAYTSADIIGPTVHVGLGLW